jgi:hypothetical protein
MTLALFTTAAILAVYRLAMMVTREEGPFDVFDRLRAAASRLPDNAEGNRRRSHWIARGLACPLCVSFWLALPAAFLVTQVAGAPVATAFGLWLPIAGGVLFLFQIGGS